MAEFETTSEQGLIYEDLLPVRWQAVADGPSMSELAKLEEKNGEVMRFIDVLEEHHPEHAAEHSSIQQELLRVELKFDLLLNLVSQLLGAYFPLPTAVEARLTPNGIQWLSPEAIDPGSHGLVEFYLSSRCPRPLVLPAKVEQLEQDGRGYRVSVQFSPMSESLRERLEKMIFRHHRRGVALARRRLTPDP
ncbi:MAG: PilZ domain-containing protein [Gammaproteobacteria bacterium]|jgi:hypothetical protein